MIIKSCTVDNKAAARLYNKASMRLPEAFNLHISRFKIIKGNLSFNSKMKTVSILSIVAAFVAATSALPVTTKSVCSYYHKSLSLPTH